MHGGAGRIFFQVRGMIIQESNNTFPKVSIIILNWNGWEDTLECLQSVQQINYPKFRILVVDNGSSDESVAQIRQAFPDVELLETGKNLGYAGGNNVGTRHALEHGVDFGNKVSDPIFVDT